MAIYDFPTTIRPARVSWKLRSNTQVHTSPLSGATQTYELPGARWEVSLEFKDLTRAEIATLEAFIIRLRGRANRARLWNHARESARGVATGTPVIANRSNRLIRSEELNSWTKDYMTVTTDVTTSPVGTTTAEKLVPTTDLQQHRVKQILTLVAGGVYTAYAWVKAADASGYKTSINFWSSNGSASMSFDPATGSFIGASGGELVASAVTSAGGGWYLAAVELRSAVGGNYQHMLYVNSPANVNSFSGDGVSGIYAWGGGVCSGGLSDYVATTTTAINYAQTGSSLRTSGWTPSQAGILLPGDYFSVGDRLHMVVEQADSDSWGNATLTIEPPLRASPADVATITTTRASALFMLADDEQAELEYLRALGSCSIRFVEALA